jgi:hypothetical protein
MISKDVKVQKPGECCGNCIETADPGFSGACGLMGETGSYLWCEHYIDIRTRDGKAMLTFELALERTGFDGQMDKLIEEMLELGKAILKSRGNGYTYAIMEEFGHVELCMEFLRTRMEQFPVLNKENTEIVGNLYDDVVRIREQRLDKWFEFEMQEARKRNGL